MTRVVVAAFGNVLRRDDGFAVAVLERLEAGPVPDGVTLRDVGIGGIHLVQDLLGEPADGLVVLDSIHLDRQPGTVVVVEPEVPDVNEMSVMQRRDELADMHYATPDRALLLLRALDALPPLVRTIGCEPVDVETPQQGLTDVVAGAVGPACAEVRRVVTEIGVPWPEPDAED